MHAVHKKHHLALDMTSPGDLSCLFRVCFWSVLSALEVQVVCITLFSLQQLCCSIAHIRQLKRLVQFQLCVVSRCGANTTVLIFTV